MTLFSARYSTRRGIGALRSSERWVRHETGLPVDPKPRQPDPEYAVTLMQPWALRRSAKYSQLLAEGKVLGNELSPVTQQGSEEQKRYRGERSCHMLREPRNRCEERSKAVVPVNS